MLKGQKGITLVALVITIIVLIILAGVSISAIFNDGLIDNAKDATNSYKTEQKSELDWLNNIANEANTLYHEND